MPLYEYRCNDCDHRFEVLQRMSAGAEGLSCPACGEARVAKQFSTFAGTVASGSKSAGSPAPACGSGGFT